MCSAGSMRCPSGFGWQVLWEEQGGSVDPSLPALCAVGADWSQGDTLFSSPAYIGRAP